jgi:hypothetical protein
MRIVFHRIFRLLVNVLITSIILIDTLYRCQNRGMHTENLYSKVSAFRKFRNHWNFGRNPTLHSREESIVHFFSGFSVVTMKYYMFLQINTICHDENNMITIRKNCGVRLSRHDLCSILRISTRKTRWKSNPFMNALRVEKVPYCVQRLLARICIASRKHTRFVDGIRVFVRAKIS